MSMFLTAVVFQSCQDDITDLSDPRDAIVKEWQITEIDSYGAERFYKVTISKDPLEITKVIFTNFHELGSVTSDKLDATLAGTTLTISRQVLGGEYTIEGKGFISDDLKRIDFDYTVDDGDGEEGFNAEFGPVVTAKKKLLVASLLQ